MRNCQDNELFRHVTDKKQTRANRLRAKAELEKRGYLVREGERGGVTIHSLRSIVK